MHDYNTCVCTFGQHEQLQQYRSLDINPEYKNIVVNSLH